MFVQRLNLARTLVVAMIVLSSTIASAIAQDEKISTKQFFKAAAEGNTEIVRTAIKQGIDVNSKTEYGATALTYACDRGHEEIVKLLLDNEADVNIRDTFYYATPLTWARNGRHSEIVKLLLENGATQSNPRKEFNEKFDKLEINEESTSDYKADAKHLQKLAGLYRSPSGVRVTFKVESGKLLTGYTGGERFLPIRPVDKNKFAIGEEVAIEFEVRNEMVSMVRWVTDEATIAFQPANRTIETPTDKPEFGKSMSSSLAADLAISSANWPQIRGNGARGVGEGQNPPVKFDATTGENLLWKTPIGGLANSSPAIWGDRVYITTAISDADAAGIRTGNYGDVKSVDDSSEHSFEVFCLDKKTGEILWKRVANKAVPKVKRHLKSTHANPTPATDGKHVVAFFGSEGLYCYSTNGQLLWKKDLGKLDSGWFYDAGYQWGFGASPIIYKDKVIVQCDIQENSFVAAFDLKSGSEIWRTEREEIPSWSSPTIVKTSNGDMLITNATKAARAYNPANGKEIWRLEGHSEIAVPTPFMAHDLIYICSGYRPVQPIYAIKSDAKGDITLEKGKLASDSISWSFKRGGPYMPTPICYGDYLYVCSNTGVLTCYKATSGERVYRNRISSPKVASFVGSPVAADGHLYFPGETGYVVVIKAGPEFEKVALNKVGENILSIPAISEGVFFVRAQNHVFAFKKKE